MSEIPLPSGRTRADDARQSIEELHLLYRNSGNVLHAWAAFREARGAGLPIPEWVLGYLDKCAFALAYTCESAEDTLDAVGLKPEKGEHAHFARAQKDGFRLSVARAAGWTFRAYPNWESKQVFSHVAEMLGVSFDYVKKAYHNFKAHL